MVCGRGGGTLVARRQRSESGSISTASNVKYGDIVVFLRDAIKAHFASRELNLKYIDPSYLIRSLPANAPDSAL